MYAGPIPGSLYSVRGGYPFDGHPRAYPSPTIALHHQHNKRMSVPIECYTPIPKRVGSIASIASATMISSDSALAPFIPGTPFSVAALSEDGSFSSASSLATLPSASSSPLARKYARLVQGADKSAFTLRVPSGKSHHRDISVVGVGDSQAQLLFNRY
ncbi:hypothetical protein BSLG_009021 [Batrachochytrium salamandrivorans]|nr:hypothetical protein BSLG_009021 [Batrachochytrium salamandrivorans]